jgi:hypothetical protein
MAHIPPSSVIGLVAFWAIGALASIPLFGHELIWPKALLITTVAALVGGFVIVVVDWLRIPSSGRAATPRTWTGTPSHTRWWGSSSAPGSCRLPGFCC